MTCEHLRTVDIGCGHFKCLNCGDIEGKEHDRDILEWRTVWGHYTFAPRDGSIDDLREDTGSLYRWSTSA